MKKRILSLLLTLVMVISLIPTTAWADEHDKQVQVIVENTTLTTGAPWTGELLNTWVTLTDASTMMTCVASALEASSITQVGADSGYISSINNLAAGTGGTYAGWMATLNDWFVDAGFSDFTVANGKLVAGDVIRVMYTVTGGSDLGGGWSSTDTTLKGLSFSAGTLSPDFNKDTLAYTLTVPSGTENITINATAANKMNQVYLSVGETTYRRTATIPVTNGAVLTVKCGDGEGAHTYTVTVAVTGTTGGTETGTGTDTPDTPPAPAKKTLNSLNFYKANNDTSLLTLSPSFTSSTSTYDLSVLDQDGDSLYVTAVPTDEGDTVKAGWTMLNNNSAGTATVSPTGRTTLANCAKKGTTGNTVTLTVGEGDDAATYTVNVKRAPTLKSLSINGLNLNETFAYSTTAYTADTLADSVTFSAEPNKNDYTIKYNDSDSPTVTLDSGATPVSITVTSANGLSTTYTVTINRTTRTDVTFNTTPTDASVVVYDSGNNVVERGADNKYQLLKGAPYSYAVTCKGYVSQYVTDFKPAGNDTITVTLTAALASTHTDVDAAWKNFRNSDVNMGITNKQTPISADTAALKWSKTLGSGWSAAPSVQIIVGNHLIVMSGTTLYKLSLDDGNVVAQATMDKAPSYGNIPPTYADGLILCPLNEGTIQAFDATTLTSVWIYHDPLKGQAQSPITYSDGYIYTGFWSSETASHNYVCLSLTDEDPTKTDELKYATWSKTVPGGFYWAGSVVVGNALIVGSDDGASGSSGTSHLYALNKTTGKEISDLALTGLGDQRSSIAYDSITSRIYFTTKGGYLCSAKVDATTGALSDLKKMNMGAQSTSTPIVYKGYVYVCAGSGVVDEKIGKCSGHFIVAKADDLSKVSIVAMQAYPQSSPLLSTAYESSGYLCFYCTYNGKPGGISLITVKTSNQTATLTELFTPGTGMQNFCTCSVICDNDGTLYYKNDSGNVFAVSDNATIAAAVIAKINAIGTVTLSSESKINDARSAYNALTAAQKLLVSNYGTLTTAETTLADLKQAAANQAAANAVKDKINAIGEVTLASEAAITAARSAYDALTDAQKALVSSDTLATLTAAEAKLAELKEQKAAADRAAADAVIAKINAVTAAIADGDKDDIKSAINDAMTAYNALTAAQKALVTNYDVLTAADSKYNSTGSKHEPVRRQPSATGTTTGSGSTGGSTTNTRDDVKSPTTGDGSHMLLWLSGTLLSAAAIAVLTTKKKRSAR